MWKICSITHRMRDPIQKTGEQYIERVYILWIHFSGLNYLNSVTYITKTTNIWYIFVFHFHLKKTDTLDPFEKYTGDTRKMGKTFGRWYIFLWCIIQQHHILFSRTIIQISNIVWWAPKPKNTASAELNMSKCHFSDPILAHFYLWAISCVLWLWTSSRRI